MSSPFATQPNPYASPATPPAPILPAGPPPAGMDYMRAYGYIFENPTWMTTVLLIAVCSLVAIIPGVSILLNLLFLGYQFEVIDWLLRTQGRVYPTFEFGRLGDYLGRGLWPFLVSLIATFVALPVIYVGMIVGVLATASLGSAEGNLPQVLAVIVGAMVALLFLVALFAMTFYLTGMTLRSGLAQDFVSGFNFSWIHDFVSRMWTQMLLAFLFLGVTGSVLAMLGLLACGVGLLVVIPILVLAYANLLYQLYVQYLARGGTPVTSKVMSAMPVQTLGGPPPMPPKPMA